VTTDPYGGGYRNFKVVLLGYHVPEHGGRSSWRTLHETEELNASMELDEISHAVDTVGLLLERELTADARRRTRARRRALDRQARERSTNEHPSARSAPASEADAANPPS
jgi:hypothetical protein